MRQYTLELKVGNSYQLPIVGDYLRVITASADFSVKPDTSEVLTGLKLGLGVTMPKPFKTITLETTADQTIQIMVGLGRVDDNRVTIGGVVNVSGSALTVSNTVKTKSAIGSIAGTSVKTVTTTESKLYNTDTTILSVTIQNLDDNNNVWLGYNNTVTLNNGFRLLPGQSITLDKAPSPEMWAEAETGTALVSVLTEYE